MYVRTSRGLGSIDAAGNVIADENSNMVKAPGMLVPFRVATRFGDAQHDAVFGAKKGDQVTGAPPGEVWLVDQLSKFEYYTSPVYDSMVANNKEAQLFRAAVVAGWVPNTPTGLETLLNSVGEGYAGGVARNGAALYDAFWAWFQTWQTGKPSLSSGASSEPMFTNPVTGAQIPTRLIAPGYPQTDPVTKVVTLLLTDGRKWTYGGIQRPIALRTGQADTDVVVNVTAFGPLNPNAPLNAMRGTVYFSDGSTSDGPSPNPRPELLGAPYPWTATTETVPQLKAKYGIAPSRVVRVREWADLSSSEQAQIKADLNLPMTTPGTIQPKPIPIPPDGSVIHVPEPSTGQEPTIKLPGTTDFVPVSSVPPAVWQAAKEYAESPSTPNFPPPVFVGEGAPNGVPTVPVGSTLMAGMGGLTGFLMIGAVVGLLLASKKRRG